MAKDRFVEFLQDDDLYTNMMKRCAELFLGCDAVQIVCIDGDKSVVFGMGDIEKRIEHVAAWLDNASSGKETSGDYGDS